MSYSRWGGSRWYTYWDAASPDVGRNEQIFTICGDASFTYKELKDHMDACIEKVGSDATKEEAEELRGYMRSFVEDVEADPKVNATAEHASVKKD